MDVDGERGGGTLGGFVEVGVAGAKHRGFSDQLARCAASSQRSAWDVVGSSGRGTAEKDRLVHTLEETLLKLSRPKQASSQE